MDRKNELIWKMQSLADATGDPDLIAGFGTPGRRIQVRNETVDTGQAWSTTSGFVDLVCAAVGSLLGAARHRDFTLVFPTTELTLDSVPVDAASLAVYLNGTRLRAGEHYSWTAGSKQITLASAAIGWVGVDYVEAVPEPVG